MDLKVILSVKHVGETKLISVNGSTTYLDFVNQLVAKWDDLKPDNFRCFYSCGSSTNVCLDCEDDLHNLLLLCSLSNVRIISVDVYKTNSGASTYHAIGNEVSFEDIEHHLSSVPLKDPAPNSSIPSTNTAVPAVNTIRPPLIDNTLLKDIPIQENTKKRLRNNGQSLEFSGDQSIPRYEMCPLVKKPCLLSDNWSDIMKDGVGTLFPGGVVEFRTEIIKYTEKKGFKFRYTKNNARYITVVCDEDLNSGCNWFVKARRQTVTLYFEITKADFVHNCIGKLSNNDKCRIGTRIIGNLVLKKVQNNPSASVKEIRKEMKIGYGIEIPYWKAHRAAEAARDKIYGSYSDSYDQLRWYCEAVERTNPGSVVRLESNVSTHKFERLFIAFKACIEGFKGYRPMLFIDGTFMKGRAKGTLLVATAKDDNNGLFPVAFAVVSAENEENWAWFLGMLRDNVEHEKQIFYLSDRNKGLMKAFPEVFDEPVHFFCLVHLQDNLKRKFGRGWIAKYRENILKYFKEAAYAPNLCIFDDKLKTFLEIGGKVAEKFVKKAPPEKWAVAHSPHITRYGEMTSNAVESFNAWIKEYRELPITHMIESIRFGIQNWYVERREDSEKWNTLLVPSKHSEWHYHADNGRQWYVTASPGGDFQVSSTPFVLVHLATRTCSCCQWQITGFPCEHAVAAIVRGGEDVTRHVDECFLTSSYKNCYKVDLNLVPETERFEYRGQFGHETIYPPKLNRQPGRPKKERFKSYGESSKKHRCADP